jgi:TonB family protein
MTAKSSTLKKLGRYEIIRELGRGAMGVVFKARDPLIGRVVALKTITAGLAQDPDLLQRFYREAQAAGSLQHPNVVTIYEMGEEGGTPFIAMEYIEGDSLELIISQRHPLPLAQKVGYIVQTCHALDYAHRRGIVHRDIKPGNIMVTKDGRVKVVDFGIARLVDTSKTQTGTLLGTLAYMSPQQLRGGHANERSDIWSVGVTFYELLSYQKPFTGQNHAALLLSIISDEPPPIEKYAPECPLGLQTLLQEILYKDEAERPQTMAGLVSELEPIWEQMQHEAVGQLVLRTHECMRDDKLPEARKLLRQALSIDTSHSQVKLLLAEVEEALKATILPEALLEHMAKARELLDEGSLEEAKAEISAVLDLDPNYGSARQVLEQILNEMERTERQKWDQGTVEGGNTVPRRAQDAEREYAVETASNLQTSPQGGKTIAEGAAKPQAAEPAWQTTRILREDPKTGKAPETFRIAPTSLRDSAPRKRAAAYGLLVIALVLGVGFGLYRKLGLRQSGAPAGQSTGSASVPTTPISLPAAGPSVEEQQRELINQAHEAADRSDYKSAQARLDDAEKLQGPLQPLIQDLRKKFALEDQSSDIREVARKETALWSEGIRQYSQNHLDRAEKAFQQILLLPEGGRRRADAQRYIDEIIPSRKNAARLASQVQENTNAQEHDRQLEQKQALATAERAKLARLAVQFQQAQQRGDEAAVQQLRDVQAQFRAMAEANGPLAADARNYAEDLIPAAIRDVHARQTKANVETAELTRFSEAVGHFNQAVATKDTNALKTSVLAEFQHIAQANESKSGEARQYVAMTIPTAIREITPLPVIGCPASPVGLAPSTKAGDLVACGLLDPPKLRWTRFAWPEFPARARQASQQEGTAMLTVTVDEEGNVVGVKPRGNADSYGFVDAAGSASHDWKTNPPRMQGKPVKTEFSVDIHFER